MLMKKRYVPTIIALSTILCVSGAGMDSNYDVDFVDAGLPEIAREVWRGHGVVRQHLFFLQMHAQYLLGPLAEQQILAALAIVVGILVGALAMIKKSYPSLWWYKDSEGMVRGPFTTSCMESWSSKGFLPDDLEIKYNVNASFAPLRELFPAPAVPFQSPPSPQRSRRKVVTVKDEPTNATDHDVPMKGAFAGLLSHADETEHGTLFEKEVSADMLRDQHEAFENRAQDLEEEMVMTLEADLLRSVQSDDVGQQAITNTKDLESWNSFNKPQDMVVDEGESAETLHRKEMVKGDTLKARRNTDKENSMKRSSSEERIRQELSAWLCREMILQHEAELEESLSKQIEAR